MYMKFMKFFRNPEIKQSLKLYFFLTFVFTCAGFIFGITYGILAFCLCLLFTVLNFCFTYRRYRKIAGLSNEISNILHGKESINLNEYCEGELAILQSEILKLTVQLREQADSLKKDKVYLADSIADISHQIRTPLTSINIILSLLSKPNLTEGRRLELVKELEGLVSRIDWLISALLRIAKLDAGTANLQKKPVSVAELIKRAVAAIAIPMELRGQQIYISMKGDETFIGDLAWSVEAIENIVKYCMDHTPNNGIIRITAQENAIYTEICITDNGYGIDKEDLPHIFERFYKGKNSCSQSVGIGLALARMIIVNQNGTIKAENNSDGGAKFTIRFYKSIV